MFDPSSESDPLDQLAEEFVERYRRGERPGLSEYVERHPDLADQIRELFPNLILLEGVRPEAGEATGAFKAEATHAPRSPFERLGEYRILREAGRGGMGVVYEAEQESLGRHVALKVLPEQALLNPTHLERFRRDAKAAAKLHHTNIVPVFGVGESAGIHFYAMQFIHGEGLDCVLHELRRLRKQPVNRGPRAGSTSQPSIAQNLLSGDFGEAAQAQRVPSREAPPAPSGLDPSRTDTLPDRKSLASLSSAGSESAFFRSVARIGLQTAEALAYAHKQGILHRDIKPSNLLLDAQGTVWVTDFGLAKTEGSGDLTHTGDIVGTLRFMAPERLDGRSLPQSDVYSLGLTLYELLTLRPAFDDASKGRLIHRVMREAPLAPRTIDPHIPRDLETIVLTCTAKVPARRYANAEALAEDLRRFLADRPIKARRITAFEQGWRWCRRNPAVASLLSVVAALLLVLAIGATIRNAELRQALTAMEDARNEALAAEHEAKERLYAMALARAQAARWSGRPGRRFDSLAALGEAANIARELDVLPDRQRVLRNEVIACLALPVDIRPERQWEGRPSGTDRIAFDLDGLHYARSDGNGAITIRAVADDRELAQVPSTGRNPSFVFSPDGRYLTVNSQVTRIWDWRRGKAVFAHDTRLTADQEGGGWIDWDPDGRRFSVRHHVDPPGFRLYDVVSRKQLLHVKAGGPYYCLAFHPHGKVVAGTAGGSIIFHDTKTGKVVDSLSQAAFFTGVAWGGRDGQLLAAVNGVDILVWNMLRRSVPPVVLKGNRSLGVQIAFNHAGDLLMSKSWDDVVRFWDPFTGRELLRTTDLSPAGLQFNRDDQRVPANFGSAGAGFWEVRRFHECRRLHFLTAREAPLMGLDFSSDNRLLGAADQLGGVRLWDITAGGEVGQVPTSNYPAFRFHPTGQELFTLDDRGVQRWPLQREARGPIRIGPPLPVASGKAYRLNSLSLDKEGNRLAIAEGEYQWRILNVGARVGKPLSAPHIHVHYIALSPDGHWLATSSHYSPQCTKIWDARTGELVVKELLPRSSALEFSPDGKWLVTGCEEEYRFWHVGTWEPGLVLRRPKQGIRVGMAFAPDSSLLAIGPTTLSVQFVDPRAGDEIATLPSLDQVNVGFHRFSPDGSLLVVGEDASALQLWDVRAIRSHLSRMGLDWDAPTHAALLRSERPHLPSEH